MNRRRVFVGVCVTVALVAIGIPIQRQWRHLQLNSDLRAAIQQDKPELVKVLLAQGADPNAIGPSHTSVVSWHQWIDRLLDRRRALDNLPSALGIAIGMNPQGDFDPNSARCNPVVISTLLTHEPSSIRQTLSTRGAV